MVAHDRRDTQPAWQHRARRPWRSGRDVRRLRDLRIFLPASATARPPDAHSCRDADEPVDPLRHFPCDTLRLEGTSSGRPLRCCTRTRVERCARRSHAARCRAGGPGELHRPAAIRARGRGAGVPRIAVNDDCAGTVLTSTCVPIYLMPRAPSMRERRSRHVGDRRRRSSAP